MWCVSRASSLKRRCRPSKYKGTLTSPIGKGARQLRHVGKTAHRFGLCVMTRIMSSWEGGYIGAVHVEPQLAPWRARIDCSTRSLPLAGAEVALPASIPVRPPSDRGCWRGPREEKSNPRWTGAKSTPNYFNFSETSRKFHYSTAAENKACVYSPRFDVQQLWCACSMRAECADPRL